MFAASQTHVPIAVEVFLADERVPFPGGAQAHVRLRRERAPGLTAKGWRAVITLFCATPLDPDDILAQAHGFLVDDESGPIGVVDEVRLEEADREAAIIVACGWFGRRCVTLRSRDVDEIFPAERRLVVRSGAPVVEGGPVGSSFARLARGVTSVRRRWRPERQRATSKPAR
jgi:hypothetical protein